ncbi:MAG: hypothetical protein JXA25_06580 [Anaerolineales bacterium]|nr:hypothetical protein [Anaerolineales bacterium]
MKILIGLIAVMILIGAGFWIYRIGYMQGNMNTAAGEGSGSFDGRFLPYLDTDRSSFRLFPDPDLLIRSIHGLSLPTLPA